MRFASTSVSLDYLEDNPVWEYLNISSHIGTRRADTPFAYSLIELNFVLKRRSLFYWLGLIVPIQTLDFLSSCVNLIPVQSGERLSYSVAILLAVFVLLVLVISYVPPSAQSVAFLSK